MISLVVLAAAVRGARGAWVGGSRVIGGKTSRHGGGLACRSPPWLRRWRRCLPEDAPAGLAPHSAAKLASVRSRPGVSPAGASKGGGDLGADALLCPGPRRGGMPASAPRGAARRGVPAGPPPGWAGPAAPPP